MKVLNLLKNILIIFSLFSFLYGANAGDTIVNNVIVNYNLCGVKKTKVLNKVSNTISTTRATIEFLIDNSNSKKSIKEIIGITKYKDKSGKIVNMPFPKLRNGKQLSIPTILKVLPTNEYLSEDLVIVRVRDLDRNIDANKTDSIEITIYNPNTGDKELLILSETTKNSGVFVGYIQASEVKKDLNNGILSVKGEDKIYASYLDGNNKITIKTKAKIIDKIKPTKGKIDFLSTVKNSCKIINNKIAGKYTIHTTSYKNSKGKFVKIKSVMLPNKKKLTPPKTLTLYDTQRYYEQDLILVRVIDKDQNKDSKKIDSIEVTVYNPNTNDKEIIKIYENSIDDGIFIGYIQATNTPTKKYNGILSVRAGNSIYTSYIDESQNKTIKDKALIIRKIKFTNAQIDFTKTIKDSNFTKKKDDNVTGEYLIHTNLFKNKNGKFVKQPTPILPNGLDFITPTKMMLYPAKEYYEDDLVLIRVDDMDQNLNDKEIDSIEVTVYDPNTGDKESLIIYESKEDSGVFIGYIQSTKEAKESGDGVLSVKAGDYIYTTYFDESQGKSVKDEALIIKKPLFLFTTKKANKKKAAVGDFVKYIISVENLQSYELYNLKLYDRLPQGLKYKEGSFRIDGKKDENRTSSDFSISKDGRLLTFNIGSIGAKAKKEISYVVEIGAVSTNKVVNKAWAKGPLDIRSNEAQYTILITNDLFIDKGLIVGKVYNKDCVDENQSSCKYGVEGVKLYMEDGRYTVTDKEGKFHFVDIARGTHVIQIDPLSIDGRYKIANCSNNTSFANRGNSQFVDIRSSELKQVNFCLEPIATATQNSTFKLTLNKDGNNRLKLNISLNSTTKLLEPEVYIALPDGVEYIKNSTSSGEEALLIKGILVVPMDKKSKSISLKVNPNYPVDDDIEAMLYYDTALEQDQHSKAVKIHITKSAKEIKISQSKIEETITNQTTQNGSKDFSWSKTQTQKSMPEFSEAMVDELGKEPKIVWPPKGWVPYIPSTKIGVLRARGTTLELTLNGKKISALNYEKLYRSSDRSMQIDYYKGVDLAEGRNIIKAIIKKGSKVIATLSREIWVESHLPSKVEFLANESYLKADGKHTPIIAVKFLAKSGHPLRGGLVGNYEIEGDYKPYKELNGKGAFKIEANGVAYIRLKPTTKSGKVKLKFALADDKVATIEAKLKPNMRDWFIVGFVEGSVGYKTLHSKMEKIDKSKIETKGRAAIFAKGMIKGKWLLTIAYDSGKSKRELFDKIDPNKYYLIYKDESSQKNEAPSTKKLYLKIEKDDFYTLFGDYKTDISGTKFANYNRSFSGLISEYEYKEWRAKAFIAKSETIHYKEELRGDGTNGYYYLKSKYIIDGSEKITIETRDRLHPERVLSKKALSIYSDYTIDYDEGRVYFKEPIYSTDKKLNPIYIIVEYDIDGEKGNNYTYGGEVRYKGKRVEAGIRAIKEDGGLIESSLVGVDTKVKLSKNLELKAEWAKSKTKSEDNTTSGSAKYLELNYKTKKTDAKAWYQKQSDNFGLGKTKSSLSNTTQMGISIKQKVNKNFSTNAEYYVNKSSKSKTNRAQVEIEYKDSNQSVKVGLRHQKTNSDSKNYLVTSYSKKYKNFNYSITHEQVLGGETKSNPTTTIVTANYKKDENTTISASINRKDLGKETKWGSTFGLIYKPWKDAEVSLNRVMESGGDSDKIFDTLRVKQRFALGKYYSLDLGYEHGESIKGDSKSFDALNSVLNYNDKNTTAHIGFSGRVEGDNKKVNVDFGYNLKVDSKQSIAFSAKSNFTWSKDNEKRDSQVALSYVYRPTKGNLVVLDKLEFKESYEKKKDEDKSQTLKLVNNLHLSYKKRKWEVGAQYGLKYLIDNIDGDEYSSIVDFIGLWAQYDLLESLSIGAQYGLLHSYSANNLDYSFGLYITKTLWDNAEATLGYNLKGFSDNDFNLQNNYSNKVYLQFRMKFDQSDFKSITQKVSK